MFTAVVQLGEKRVTCSLPGAAPGSVLTALSLSFSTAHSRRRRRWRPVASVARQLSGGLPSHAFHRVQRRPWDLPLLCQQVQLLAHHHPRAELPGLAVRRHAQGGAHPDPHQPLPGVHEEPVTPPRPRFAQVHPWGHVGAYS